MDGWEYRQCGLCEREFQCHAELVPRLFGRPVCHACVLAINELRTDTGLPAIRVQEDTYYGAPT